MAHYSSSVLNPSSQLPFDSSRLTDSISSVTMAPHAESPPPPDPALSQSGDGDVQMAESQADDELDNLTQGRFDSQPNRVQRRRGNQITSSLPWFTPNRSRNRARSNYRRTRAMGLSGTRTTREANATPQLVNQHQLHRRGSRYLEHNHAREVIDRRWPYRTTNHSPEHTTPFPGAGETRNRQSDESTQEQIRRQDSHTDNQVLYINMPILCSQPEFYMTAVVPVDATTEDLSEKGECSICLEPLEQGVIKFLACGHMFHTVCAQSWFDESAPRSGTKRGTCPNCRCDLYEPDPAYGVRADTPTRELSEEPTFVPHAPPVQEPRAPRRRLSFYDSEGRDAIPSSFFTSNPRNELPVSPYITGLSRYHHNQRDYSVDDGSTTNTLSTSRRSVHPRYIPPYQQDQGGPVLAPVINTSSAAGAGRITPETMIASSPTGDTTPSHQQGTQANTATAVAPEIPPPPYPFLSRAALAAQAIEERRPFQLDPALASRSQPHNSHAGTRPGRSTLPPHNRSIVMDVLPQELRDHVMQSEEFVTLVPGRIRHRTRYLEQLAALENQDPNTGQTNRVFAAPSNRRRTTAPLVQDPLRPSSTRSPNRPSNQNVAADQRGLLRSNG